MRRSVLSTSQLREMCLPRLKKYYPTKTGQAQAALRLDQELTTVESLGKAGPFLRSAEVGRLIASEQMECRLVGAGCGSILLHLLGLSAVDPLRYGLYFERLCSSQAVGSPHFVLYIEPNKLGRIRSLLDADRDHEIKNAFTISQLTAEEMTPKHVGDIIRTETWKSTWDRIAVNDPTTFRLIQSGDVEGVFELNTEEVRELQSQTCPKSVDELAATTALALLARSNVRDAQRYIDRLGGQPWEAFSVNSDIHEILKETRGIILYHSKTW